MNLPEDTAQHDDRAQDQPRRPKEGPTETRFENEPEGHEGTLGGQPPLNAPAGIQRAGRGGVLVQKSANAASENADDEKPRQPQ